jgi:tetratricopeptide (TPR) repeat protein
VTYGRIGDLYARQGKPDEAIASHRAGLAVIERLVARDAAILTWQRDRSITFDKIGNIEFGRGALAEALTNYRQSLGVRLLVASAAPRSVEARYDLAVSYDKIGEVLAAQGARADAVESFRASLAILERLSASDPDNIGWQFDVVELNRALAVSGDDAARRFSFVAETLPSLQTRRPLNAEQAGWLAEAEAALAKLKEAPATTP